MRVFQYLNIGKLYLSYFNHVYPRPDIESFTSRRQALIDHRYGSVHILEPMFKRDANAFLAFGDDVSQLLWAKENNVNSNKPEDILLAQIESHKSEVFYTNAPVELGKDFLSRLPGCVRLTICWRAAPTPKAVDLSKWDLRVCNFPSILASWLERGWKTGFLPPAHDPDMDSYASRTHRPVDICFVGGWTQYHARRAKVMLAVAGMSNKYQIKFHFSISRLSKLASLPFMHHTPLRRWRMPEAISKVAVPPVFGRGLYESFSSSKIVINGAIDMAGQDRGNMRCFEAMGCGAVMVSDSGQYPEGMVPGENFITYDNSDDLPKIIGSLLNDESHCLEIGRRANYSMSKFYSRKKQWDVFMKLVEGIA